MDLLWSPLKRKSDEMNGVSFTRLCNLQNNNQSLEMGHGVVQSKWIGALTRRL